LTESFSEEKKKKRKKGERIGTVHHPRLVFPTLFPPQTLRGNHKKKKKRKRGGRRCDAFPSSNPLKIK